MKVHELTVMERLRRLTSISVATGSYHCAAEFSVRITPKFRQRTMLSDYASNRPSI